MNSRYKIVWEVAGRDSVAAIIRFIQKLADKSNNGQNAQKITSRKNVKSNVANPGEEKLTIEVIPSVVHHFAMFEFKKLAETHIRAFLSWSQKSAPENVLISVSEPSFTDASQEFRQVTGTIGQIQAKGFHFQPCPACHLLVHIIRGRIAAKVNTDIIVTGERRAHGTKIKPNQTPSVLNLFKKLVKTEFGITLEQPLRDMTDNNSVENILKNEFPNNELPKGRDDCAFSGSAYDDNNQPVVSESETLQQLNEIYIPMFLGKKYEL